MVGVPGAAPGTRRYKHRAIDCFAIRPIVFPKITVGQFLVKLRYTPKLYIVLGA